MEQELNDKIILKGVKVHNLKRVSLSLPRNELIVFTGVSGSGKSSLAFDTIYVEGQRRYLESLSTHARRHLPALPKPEAEAILGITPTIAIEQKGTIKSPRSTVGTLTGIYDYLRILFARAGTPHCPLSKEAIRPQGASEILEKIEALPQGTKLLFTAPWMRGKKGEFKEEFSELLRRGFTRLRVDGSLVDLSEEISLDPKVSHDIDFVVDRILLTKENQKRVIEAVKKGLELGKGMLNVATGKEELFFSEHGFSKTSGLSYPPLEPQDFSFNHPKGACPFCQGLGEAQHFILEKIIDFDKSLSEDCFLVGSSYQTVRFGNICRNLARLFDFHVTTPWKKLSKKAQEVLLHGTEEKALRMLFVHPEKGSRWIEYVRWRGVLQEAKERFLAAASESYKEKMRTFMEESVCPECGGARIAPYPAATLFKGKKIFELTALPLEEAALFFERLTLTKKEALIVEEVVKEIYQRLLFLKGVGLHYLSLDRATFTLSGGEAQRVRLASQLGSGLVDATYILDEPSIGLHPSDHHKLIESLKRLRDRGNSVLVVEHDEEMIRAADTIVDIGPLAGEKGGEILFQGDLPSLLRTKTSLTGAYLSLRKTIPIPGMRRKGTGRSLELLGATHHNLKDVSLSLPLGCFLAVTGVSGSGKSSLIVDTLFPALSNHLHHTHLKGGRYLQIKGIEGCDKVIAIDQSPIGKSSRSNPATYIKLFDEIRSLFAQLPEAAAFGFRAGRFSFNVKEGSCLHCRGMGEVKIDMDFLEDEWIVCPHCKGTRFDEKTLSCLYRGKNIFQVLQMTASEAFRFFEALPKIREKIQMLLQVGLDYLRLGQPSPTLSGGEAQRIKLAKELSRPSTGKTFYILDEPTTGLHFHDMERLIRILDDLVERGNTVLVIEHNMELVKTADWVIDMGPEGGKKGGEVIAQGTPETLAAFPTPTGRALYAGLNKKRLPSKKKKSRKEKKEPFLTIKGACQNNLKHLSLKIPRSKITVCTGPSGSGKSSLAYDTIFAEGQRRYIETLPSFFRQFIKQPPKPLFEEIDGLSPAIAIEQKSHAGNPRSTVGTITEAYDYLRLLFAHLGTPYCPETGQKIETISKERVVDELLKLPTGSRLHILSPLSLKKESFEELQERLQRRGYLRLRLDRTYFELDEKIPYDRGRKQKLYLVIDRLVVKKESRERLLEAVEQAASLTDGALIAALPEEDLFFNLSFAVPGTGKSYPPITFHTFSFNAQQGMCLECSGLGFQWGADLMKERSVMRLTPLQLMELLFKENGSPFFQELMQEIFMANGITPSLPLKELSLKHLHLLMNGAPPFKRKGISFQWRGIQPALAKLAKSTAPSIREALTPLLHATTCPSCNGTRLNPLARHVLIDTLSIADLSSLPISEAMSFVRSLPSIPPFLQEAVFQLQSRLNFLDQIGLGYLSLDRSAPTLSGGEMQRIRLARQLGSALSGCTYILDEPTLGLHPYDNTRLNDALKELRNLGNTLILVEHDPLTISVADHLIDFGPKAGAEGGEITAQGTLSEIKANPRSLTGAYLSGKRTIPLPIKRRSSSFFLTVKNATFRNLKELKASFPVGALSCITGVSGSGKSTLLNDLLKPAFEKALRMRPKPKEILFEGAGISGIERIHKLLVVDQNPIGHTQRADISTYVDLLTPLRIFFAALPEAKMRGLLPRHFSFNHIKGMCRSCWGLGKRSIPMQLLPPVQVPCEACHGYRLNPLSLSVTTEGRHLGQLLELSVDEATRLLPPLPKILRILDTLSSVGLGYLKLGQEIATLSGGEAQRIRLSKELAKQGRGKTLYLFDEPTIGLHSEDIRKLLKIFHRLANAGHTLILIEHNLDVIAACDHIVDLGPFAGKEGGAVMGAGTPEEIALLSRSLTGSFLKPFLAQKKKES